MMKYKNTAESSPLMIESEPEYIPQEENPLATTVSKKKRTRKTSLVINDSIILLVEFCQIFALIQSMSLRWAFPYSWINATYYTFWINLDFWEFFKVNSETYKGIQNYDNPSVEMPFSYDYYLLVIGLLVLLTLFIFLVTYLILRFRRRPYLFVHVSRMQRAVTILCQIFTIPVGVALFRLFQCNSVNQVDVMNDVQCFADIHWAYIAPSVLVFVGLFLAFPVWMIYRIRREVLAATTDHHESYLQLKEMEYMSGLDVIWVVKGFHLFSSFNLRAVFYRPIIQFFKLVLLIVYAAAFSNIFAQALSTAVVLSAFWLLMLYLRPFRITSFNVMVIFGYLCLLGDVIFGSCISYSKPSLVESPWLVQPYAVWVLASINLILVLACILFLLHLMIYTLCCYRKMGKDPIWPSMVARNNSQVSKETKKYIYAVLKGRTVLEKCRTMPPLFSPVHELTQQIQVINAFLRESEKLEDGLHDTLWDLLDEMIDTHRQIEPQSLFSDDVKESIKQNAEEFLTYMPSFSRRLAQRDYDFILVSPLKKRLLLKMNILGMFLHGRKYQKQKQHMMYPEIKKMWPHSPKKTTTLLDGEYCDDLYPERLLGPDTEEMFESSTLHFPLELTDIDESDETESTAMLIRPNSISDFKSQSGSLISLRSGKDNPGFITDQPTIKDDKLILMDQEIGESSVDETQQNMSKHAENLISLLDETNQSDSETNLDKFSTNLKSSGLPETQSDSSKQNEDLITTHDETGSPNNDVDLEQKRKEYLINTVDETGAPQSDVNLDKFPATLKISGVEEGETTTDLIEIESEEEEEEEEKELKSKKGGKGRKGKGKSSTGKKGKKKK
ncbi:hypothetical protein LOTGIDRAFT_234257 [Lottia gigantea]|uniref:Uncharacterized protein n=1 Tax=Lottia gigantea TaxID=225164 RepID=V4A8P3_LOTGI|nr:hypothetical protein LOTGIDRAFT_234257 [Lottia gigantea]ESO89671.1 hypothetical protein LOTGIDRAFT_234257 [Lottia gigantea]